LAGPAPALIGAARRLPGPPGQRRLELPHVGSQSRSLVPVPDWTPGTRQWPGTAAGPPCPATVSLRLYHGLHASLPARGQVH